MSKSEKIELRVTPELKSLVKEKATSEGLSVSSWLSRLITININNGKEVNE